jgi:hypothetical protein
MPAANVFQIRHKDGNKNLWFQAGPACLILTANAAQSTAHSG